MKIGWMTNKEREFFEKYKDSHAVVNVMNNAIIFRPLDRKDLLRERRYQKKIKTRR